MLSACRRLIVGLAILVTTTGCFGASEPRAYPGTQDRSLPDLLTDFKLELPPCKVEGLRYYSRDSLSEDLSLTFTLPEICLHRYLTSLGIDESSDEFIFTGDSVGISSSLIKKLDWSINSKTTYDVYSARPTITTSYDIVVDRHGKQPIVYMEGINSG